MSKTISRAGFTLIELTIVLSILILIGGVGSKVDLVDLLDNEKYLADNDLQLDTPSLIARLEAAPKDGDEFLIQVVCSELANRGKSEALPQLEKLVNHDDFFVSKRAELAISRIRAVKKQQTPSILERIRPMLPEKSKLAFDASSDFKSNLDHTQNLFRAGLQNETLSMIQKKIGNAQVDSLQIVALNEDRNSFLVLATGYFYQKKVSESLQQMTFKENHEAKNEWAGEYAAAGSQIRVALSGSRALAAEISLDVPFTFGANELLQIAGELNKE